MTTSNSYNLADLYKKAFGITGVRFAIPNSQNNILGNIADTAIKAGAFAVGQVAQGVVNGVLNANGQQYDFEGIETIPFPTTSVTSILGTPIYEQITFTIPSIVEAGVVKSPQKTYTLPGWPLFDIAGQNVIEKTPLQGRKGTIKEFIYEDDYAITIRGILINEDEQAFPETDFQELAQVLNAKVALGITSQVFNLLDIHNIVIERWRFPEVEGFPSMQPFELECLSDYPAELEIKSVKTRKPIIAGL